VVERSPAKIALALGGGVARVFAHFGVVKALEARGIKIHALHGYFHNNVSARSMGSNGSGSNGSASKYF
jgi:NTE family protein